MSRRKTITGFALFNSVVMSTTVAAAPNSTRGANALRDRMAGAWRGTLHGDVLHIDGDLCATALGSQQTIFTMQYQGDVARRTLAFTGMAVPGELVLQGDMLVMRVLAQGVEVSYSRLDTVPDSVRIDPLTLGRRSLNEGQVSAIRREIAQRSKKVQDVRTKSIGTNDPSTLQAMVDVDRENTLRLIELIQDVGWLSAGRFGKETQLGAFLIVQHRRNVRLMRTALPLIEKEAKADPSIGQLYALLYDRLQMSLGKKQRFGTQIVPSPMDGMTIARLEDGAQVDEWRREMGMQTLADYMKMVSARNGTKITIGD